MNSQVASVSSTWVSASITRIVLFLQAQARMGTRGQYTSILFAGRLLARGSLEAVPVADDSSHVGGYALVEMAPLAVGRRQPGPHEVHHLGGVVLESGGAGVRHCCHQ